MLPATARRPREIPSVVAIVAVTAIAYLLGGFPSILPAAFVVVLLAAVPMLATSSASARFAPVAVLLLALVESTPSYVPLLAIPAAIASLLPFRKMSVPLLASLAMAIGVFHGTPAALVSATAALVLTTLAASKVATRSNVVSAAAFLVAAMTLATVPLLAISSDRVSVAAVAFAAALVAMIVSVVSLRSTGALPRKIALVAASLLIATPFGLVSTNDDGAGIAAGINASPNMAECPKLGNDTIKAVECYAAVLIDEYRTNGLPSAISLVERAYDAPAPLGSHFAENCHESLHFLAKATALSLTGDIRDAIAAGTDMCAAGFGHGVWEMQYGAMPTTALVSSVPTICRGWEGLDRSEEGAAGIGCRHILGHTLATRYRGNVEDVASVCLIRDPLVDSSTELTQDETISQNNCLAGLFMENFLDLNRFRNNDINGSDPFDTCEHPKIVGDERLMWGCYNEVGAMVVPWSDYDLNTSLRACKSQAETFNIPEFVKLSCYDSIARSIGPALAYESDQMIGACASVDPGELQTYCVKGIAAAVGFNSNDIDLANLICEKNLPDAESRKLCTDRIDEVAAALESSKVAGDRGTPASPAPPTTSQGVTGTNP